MEGGGAGRAAMTSSGGQSMLRASLTDKDEILMDFVMSEREVNPVRRRDMRCCEGLSRGYVLWLIYTLRVGVALVLASVFLYLPAVTAVMPRSLFFLVLLAASLSVRPFLGQALFAVFSLPLQICTQLFATGVSFLMPNDPAFSSFIIFLGVFAAHWMDLGTGPGPGKIVAAIWLITMTSKQLIPSYQAVPAAYGLIIGLCLAQCAVLCAQLLPPLTVKRVIDEGLATSSKSLSALLTMVHKEFARSHESKRFTHAPLRAHRSMMSTKSIPSKIAAEPKFLRSYVQAASGHGFHSADRLERADALQDAAQQSLDRLAMLPFLQAERPLGDLGNYAKCGAMLRDVLARALEMREAVPDLQPHADTRINRYRVELAPVFRTLTRHVCETVESAGKAASDKEALGRLKEQQQQLTAVMEATRLAVQETRDRHFGESFREAFRNGPVEDVPVRSILATHVVMQCTWQICLMVSTVAFGEAFVPYSSQPVLNTIKGWFNMWSNKAPVPRDYLRSHAFRLRLSNALIVSLAVCASLCFVYIPVLQSIFSQGTWVSLTALFVFTSSSGATLRAARDRLLGIFVGTSYSFIALLILRYTTDPTSAAPPVALTVFIVVFVVCVFALMQESMGLALASSYAVILMMNALPPNQASQNSLILANFLNTFIGAVMVTLFSGWSFLFRSSRVEMATTLDSLARQYGDVLTVCTGRLDYETLTEESLAEAPLVAGRVAALAAPVAQLEALLADVQIEPSLWRAPVREDQWQGVISTCKKISTELLWLDSATRMFLRDLNETREDGMLDNNALPLILGLKSELSDALQEVGTLLHMARHPQQQFKMAWRPEGIEMAQALLMKNALRLSLVENLFVIGKKENLVATGQVLAFSATLFSMDKLATSIKTLWMHAYNASCTQRRMSVFFKA